MWKYCIDGVGRSKFDFHTAENAAHSCRYAIVGSNQTRQRKIQALTRAAAQMRWSTLSTSAIVIAAAPADTKIVYYHIQNLG